MSGISVVRVVVFARARRAGAWLVLALVLVLATMAALAATAGARGPAPSHSTFTRGHSLLKSRELWATIDVCNPPNQPDTVGIRGSMPADGHPKDAMYMRFQLQYLNPQSKLWSTPAHGADSGFVTVGAAKTARQGGSSFQLGAPKGQPGYTMRGVVTFQWRRAGQVAHQTTRTTSAGHQSVAGADPAGYSAAQCTIG